MLKNLISPAAAALALALMAGAAQANEVPVPDGDVILTVTGAINTTNVDDSLQFDRESFAALGLETVETTTIWTDGPQVFEGVPLVTLAGLLGVEQGIFRATAVNDYTIEIPVTDAVEGGPIIAIMLNGEEMSLRDKGPLWVIYPYDTSADYRSEAVYSRSIWQLDRIEVTD